MPLSVSVCTIATPEHALGALRLAAPLREAGVRSRWFHPTGGFDPADVAESDLIVVQRDFPRHTDLFARVLAGAERQGRPVVFEIDDLLWALPEDHPDRISGYYAEALWPMLFAALEADAVTVASPGLQERLQPLNEHVHLLPNYLDETIWPFRPPKRPEGAGLVIGYAGGASHGPDLARIAPALLNVLAEWEGRARLRILGVQPPEALSGHPQVEWRPLEPGDYAGYARALHEEAFDLLILPLAPSPFNAAKSAVKFLEYTTLGAPVVCSRIPPYEGVIEHGESGFLVRTSGEWQEALGTLLRDPELRVRMAARAQEAVRASWLLCDHAHRWPEVYEEIIRRHRPRTGRAARAQLIAGVAAQLAGRDRAREEALESGERVARALETELQEIRTSRAWKLAQVLRRWRARLSSRE